MASGDDVDVDNSTLQEYEIEALTAIYEKDLIIDEDSKNQFSIVIRSPQQDKDVTLQVTFPPDYPKISPPYYQLSAPWMKREDKIDLYNKLENIYCENIGENIIHRWIDKISEEVEMIISNEEKTESKKQLNKSKLQLHSPSKPTICIKEPNIYHGEPITERKSTFQAHLARVSNVEEAKFTLLKLKENRKIASATHNIYAYRIQNTENTLIQDCEDDGETHAGSRLLHLLQILDVKNVIVVVSRWYGGIHLGPERFKHINNVARDLLQQHNFILQQIKMAEGFSKWMCYRLHKEYEIGIDRWGTSISPWASSQRTIVRT
ncbi:protein IMPACT-like isoform X2 [Centruroides sculpturatus]|uniref:protein IMPACT-like isoform X2 n=1 Tax=Centruroides sculpturatus TaxID=218467 RepID=UPI000C6D05BD|nr:protein IMPACT-like isoform X2 [Centruroides sculpturatus]